MQRGNRRDLNQNNQASTKIHISNLNKDFTNHELQSIFRKYGVLTQCGIHWDRLGNSKGTATVEFDILSSSRAAIRDLNNQNIAGFYVKLRYVQRGGNQMFRKSGLRLGNRRGGQQNNRNYNRINYRE